MITNCGVQFSCGLSLLSLPVEFHTENPYLLRDRVFPFASGTSHLAFYLGNSPPMRAPSLHLARSNSPIGANRSVDALTFTFLEYGIAIAVKQLANA